ncbi:LPS assembly lipoprotein LptE [Candidatus Omnitrophota bacterium]
MKSKRSSLRLSAIRYPLSAIMCVIILSGCGYTTGVVLPNNIKTIQVAIFKNKIDITKEVSAKDKYEVYRPNLEVDLRDAIIERVFLDGNLKVASGSIANAILSGEITQYRKDPLRYQNEEVREYRISLVCDFKLLDSGNGEVLIEEDGITGDTTYFTTGTLQKSETSALTNAMQDLARRIVNRIVESW